MAKAIEILIGKEIVSEYDTDEVKTTWIIRSLSGFEFIEATKHGYVDHEYILTHGITGWKDFKDASGNPLEFSIENIARIPPVILQELSFAIQEMASIGESERKN